MPSDPSTIETVRKRVGLTQTQMADRLGMSLRQIQTIEGDPSAEREIHRLAAAYLSLALAVANKAPGQALDQPRDLAIGLAALVEDTARETPLQRMTREWDEREAVAISHLPTDDQAAARDRSAERRKVYLSGLEDAITKLTAYLVD